MFKIQKKQGKALLSEFVKFDSIKEQIYRFTNLNKEHVYILKCSGFPVSQSHMEDRT